MSAPFIRRNGIRFRAALRCAALAKATGLPGAGGCGGTLSSWITKLPLAGARVGHGQGQALRSARAHRERQGPRSRREQAGIEREVQARRGVRNDGLVLRRGFVRGEGRLEGLGAALREENVEAVALRRILRGREGRDRIAARRVSDGGAVQAEAGVGVGDVADDEAAGQRRARERADLDVVHLPPPRPEALVVEARLDVRMPRSDRHVRERIARARQIGPRRRPDVRPARAAVDAHVDARHGAGVEVDEVVGPLDRRGRLRRTGPWPASRATSRPW